MKLLSVALGCCLSYSAFAANQHSHVQSKSAANVPWTFGCEIEIVNRSYDDVTVFGVFDDGSPLAPFNIYSFEAPHYISLYYNGYCHDGMELDIDSFSGAHIYGNYVRVGSTIRIVPYLLNQVKAEVRPS